MTALHTAAFYFGWFAVVGLAFVVIHFARKAASAFGRFWTRFITPLLTWCGKQLDKFSGTVLIAGVVVTIFGTLVCASSTRWLAITDVHSFIAGIAILALGMAATIRAAD